MRTQQRALAAWEYRRTATAVLSALGLVVSCTSSNSDGVSSGAAGNGGSGAIGVAGSADGGTGAGEGGGSNAPGVGDAGSVGSAGEAGAAGSASSLDHLPGEPSSPARAALQDVPPPPAADADIVDGVIMSRLDVWLKPNATVAQVNAALDASGARLLSMTVGSSVISVAFPAARDAARLEQQRQALEAAPGIQSAELATVTVTESLPPGPARVDANIGHLQTARFPAAWNLKAVAIKNCESRKVNVVVLDHFDAPTPALFATEVPGFQAPPPAGNADHGWRTTSDIAAASFIDGETVTGANPFVQCLNLLGVQAANMTGIEAQANLWQHLPSGKVIVNISLGHAPPRCTNCMPSDFESESTWLLKGLKVATDWRALARERDDELLIAESAGNDGQSAAGLRYSLFREAQLSGSFSLAASPLVFGTPRLTVFDAPDTFAPESQYSDYPSLLPKPDLRAAALALIADQVPNDVGAAPNVVIVGSTTRGEPRTVVQAPFSNSNADVYSVGVAVPGVGTNGDTPEDGTSFSAPQVAGLASYLWLLSSDLRQKPTSYTRQAIVENAPFAAASGVHVLDAYAAVLSLDAAETVTPSSAPMRLALLDMNDDGAFTETDVTELAGALLGGSGQPPRNWDRHDLNGDGYSGFSSARFDLDRDGSLQYGLASYTTVQQTYQDHTVDFDETNVSDFQILCYYAYSALYTGAAAARDTAIGDFCGMTEPAPPVYDPTTCHGIDVHKQHDVCGYSDITCCPGLICIDASPNDGYASLSCELP